MQCGGDLVKLLAVLYNVEAPAGAVFFGNVFETLQEDVMRTRRKVQSIRDIVRRREPQQCRVERDDLGDSCAGEVCYQAHVDRVGRGYFVGEFGGVGHQIGKTVELGILRHDGRGDDARDVVLRLGGKRVEAVELPEVGVAGLGDGVLHVTGTPVIGGHREVPVAKLVMKFLHIPRIGEGGLPRIEALIEVAVAIQSIASLRHELPHATGAGAAIQRLWLKARLRNSEIDQVLWNALVAQDLRDHQPVLSGALE